MALLIAGVVGVFVVDRRSATLPGGSAEGPNPTRTSVTTAAGPTGTGTIPLTTPSTVGGSAPTHATLQANLLDFPDLGGFFDPVPSASATQLAASPCLRQLAPAGAASSAQTYFAGPSRGSLPAINEVVSGYNGGGAAAAFAHDVSVVQSCTPLTVSVAGATATVRLSPVAGSLPPEDTERAFSGTTLVAGRTWSINVGLVLQPQMVVLVIWIDSIPPSNTIYGNFPSTVAAAVGKLA